jgi:hypothetical protein
LEEVENNNESAVLGHAEVKVEVTAKVEGG